MKRWRGSGKGPCLKLCLAHAMVPTDPPATLHETWRRLLSYVTNEVLDTADQLQDVLGDDLANALVKHRSVVHTLKSNIANESAVSSTWELLRQLKVRGVSCMAHSGHNACSAHGG